MTRLPGVLPPRAGLLVCAAALLASCAGGGHGNHRPQLPTIDIEENLFRANMRALMSEESAGRRPGTPGEDQTVEFLTSQMRRLGLKPGIGDSYLQSVPLVELTAASTPTLDVSGAAGRVSLGYAQDMLILSPRELSEAALRRSELVFVGYGIAASDYHWNDYAGLDVHGKTVMVLMGDPGTASRDPHLFRGSAGTYYGQGAYKVAEAFRQGASGVLLIHDAGIAGAPWNVLVAEQRLPQLQAVTADGSPSGPMIEGWVTLNAARSVFKLAGQDFEAMATAATRPAFKGRSLGLTADATVHNALRRIASSNVVGWLPGKGHRREVVIYAAHWDQLGRQSPEDGGAVFGGAVNDAAGVAGLLTLARSLSHARPGPDRSIAFIAFTAGAAGSLGSAYYVEHPVFPLRDTVAVLDLDLPHIGGPTRDVMVFGNGNSELEDDLADLSVLQGREVHPDPYPEQGFYYRADGFNFALSGVPALYAEAGLDDSARGPAWGRRQFDDYLAHRYRQSGDTYSPDWDLRGTVEDLSLYRDLGLRLAQQRHFPRFYPDSEFRLDRSP